MKLLEQNNFVFTKLPKFLNKGKFAKLTNSTKLAYSIFLNLFDTAKYINQVDSNGYYYITITDANLATALNISSRTVSKIKSDLEDMGLIFQKRMGFSTKTKKNLPNRIYLLQPSNLEDEDFASNKKVEHKEKNADPKNQHDNSKITDKSANKDTNHGSEKNASLLKLDLFNKNINSIDSKEKLFAKNTISEKNILNNASLRTFGSAVENCFDENTLIWVKLLSNNLKTANHIFATIFSAKKEVENQYFKIFHQYIPLELSEEINDDADEVHTFRFEITETLKHVANRFKLNKVKNLTSYLYSCLENTFTRLINEKARFLQDQNTTNTFEY